MNEMIERYIYDVTRRLPENERGEITRELETSIIDMLQDNPSEQDITAALTKLGTPRNLAEQYRQKPRYLISPAMFELYISVLKTVIAIVTGIFACIGILSAVSSGSVGEMIGAGISTAIEGALQAAFWVTFGFAMTDRYGAKLKPWTVSDLPRLPDQKGVKISRSSSIVGMVMSVFFSALVIMMIIRDEWFFVFVRGSEVINPLSQAATDRLVPYIILLGILGLVMNSLKLFWARWNLPLCIANIVHNIAWVSIVIFILHWPDLISDEIITLANTLTGNADTLRQLSSGGIVIFFSVVFVIAAAIDISTSGWKTWKGMREPR